MFILIYHDVTFSQATTISWSELEWTEVTTFSISHLVSLDLTNQVGSAPTLQSPYVYNNGLLC